MPKLDLPDHLERLATMLRGDTVTPDLFPDAMKEAAERIRALENALRDIPDLIELFRLMKAVGRKRVDMAKAVAEKIEEIRRPLI